MTDEADRLAQAMIDGYAEVSPHPINSAGNIINKFARAAMARKLLEGSNEPA